MSLVFITNDLETYFCSAVWCEHVFLTSDCEHVHDWFLYFCIIILLVLVCKCLGFFIIVIKGTCGFIIIVWLSYQMVSALDEYSLSYLQCHYGCSNLMQLVWRIDREERFFNVCHSGCCVEDALFPYYYWL